MNGIVVELGYTAKDLRKMPPGPPHWQLVEGELVREPPATPFHQGVAANLMRILGNHVHERQSGILLAGPAGAWISNRNVFEPDIMFIPLRRRSDMKADGLHGAPDFAVEILSRSSLRRDRFIKRRIYAKYGTDEYWLIDPKGPELAIYLFGISKSRPVRTVRPGHTVTSRHFPGLEIVVSDIFDLPWL